MAPRYLCWSIHQDDDGNEIVFGKVTIIDVCPSAAARQYAAEYERLMPGVVHEVRVSKLFFGNKKFDRFGMCRSVNEDGSVEYIAVPIGQPAIA